jgi:hypothetical protein
MPANKPGFHMKTISWQAAREKAVANILASLSFEHLRPSPATIKGLHACLAGQCTMQQLLAEALAHHIKPR